MNGVKGAVLFQGRFFVYSRDLPLRRMRFAPHTVLSIEGDCPHAVKEDEN